MRRRLAALPKRTNRPKADENKPPRRWIHDTRSQPGRTDTLVFRGQGVDQHSALSVCATSKIPRGDR